MHILQNDLTVGNFPFVCRKTLQLSRQLRDQVMEAQACYSLGNTYTLLQQYERAVDYHLKHLFIAQELTDRWGVWVHHVLIIHSHRRSLFEIFYFLLIFLVCVCFRLVRVGEGRACWSLGNAYVSLGDHKQALHYARKHLDISKEVSHLSEKKQTSLVSPGRPVFELNQCALRATLLRLETGTGS